VGDGVVVIGGIFGSITDIARLAQDPNSAPWDYIGAGAKTAKNVVILYITLIFLLMVLIWL
jgi:hypothetical protein